MTSIHAWHFLRDDGTTGNGGCKPEPGGTETWDGPLVICQSGLHASRRAIDALKYAPGALVRRVVISGKVVEGDDKLIGRKRRELWRVDATATLHEFACLCAEDALKVAKVEDPLCFAAIAAKRAWLRGEITDSELYAAMDAAWATAMDAAWTAARVAAWTAAWDAAWDAAWTAAWAAAWTAAWAAAWAAARVAAMDAQNKRLEKMLKELHEKGSK